MCLISDVLLHADDMLLFSLVNNRLLQPISGRCSHFIPPENTRKSKVFKRYKMGTLVRNRLNFHQRNKHRKSAFQDNEISQLFKSQFQ